MDLIKTKYTKDRTMVLVREPIQGVDNTHIYQSAAEITRLVESVFHLSLQTEEYVVAVFLDTALHCIGCSEISHGCINMSIVSPSDIYKKALLLNASHVIMVHNHPSLSTVPSKDDVKITEQMKSAGEILGIKFLDSIIIGNGYYSFLENRKE